MEEVRVDVTVLHLLLVVAFGVEVDAAEDILRPNNWKEVVGCTIDGILLDSLDALAVRAVPTLDTGTSHRC